mmetsp:Transcript_38060/g.79130  ORF Transcript_38060/g.79130 Transcript_38060/m.79130 type:complete len:91 (-) Transcript_38060:223-495(-)
MRKDRPEAGVGSFYFRMAALHWHGSGSFLKQKFPATNSRRSTCFRRRGGDRVMESNPNDQPTKSTDQTIPMTRTRLVEWGPTPCRFDVVT